MNKRGGTEVYVCVSERERDGKKEEAERDKDGEC